MTASTYELTARDKQLLLLLARGATEKEICDALKIRRSTLELMLSRLRRHFRVHSTAALSKLALARRVELEPKS